MTENQTEKIARIIQIRTDFGLSQAEFGQKLGLTQANISDIERGKTKIKFGLMEKIQEVFGISIDFLQRGEKTNMYAIRNDTQALSEEQHEYSVLKTYDPDPKDELIATQRKLIAEYERRIKDLETKLNETK